jgi:hypothetical protein
LYEYEERHGFPTNEYDNENSGENQEPVQANIENTFLAVDKVITPGEEWAASVTKTI